MVDWNDPVALKQAIADTGLSVRAFASEADVSGSQLYRLIDGDFKPRFDSQRKIEAALARLRESPTPARAA
jgi:predicted transcriptional regulator